MKELYNDIERINSLDPSSLSERLCKLFEEAGELAQAVNKKTGRKVVNESEDEIRDLILEEAADTIQCTISLLASIDISYEELIQKIEEKNKKWVNVIKKVG